MGIWDNLNLEVTMDIKLLRDQKQKLKLSYDEIAELSGIPKTTVTNILTGRTQNPRIDTLKSIEEALGIIDGVTQEEYNAGWRRTKTRAITPFEDDVLYAISEIERKYGTETKEAALVMLENMAGIKK